MTVRFSPAIAAATLAAVTGLGTGAGPARAQTAGQVSADYAVSFLGLSIGRGTMV